jgi:dual specificity protein kinase YAK1
MKLHDQRYILTSCNSGSDTEKTECLSLLDFLRGLLEVDPNKRWSPLQVFADDTGAFICGFSFLL